MNYYEYKINDGIADRFLGCLFQVGHGNNVHIYVKKKMK